MALRAQRNSTGHTQYQTLSPVFCFLSQSLITASMKNYRVKQDMFCVNFVERALYRDRALSEVGLPYQNVEKYGLALPGLLLSLSDDVT